MGEEKVVNIRLLKSYMGYGPGTVGQYVERGDRIVLLMQGNSNPLSAAVFKAGQGEVYEITDAAPTPPPVEPKMDPADLAPIAPEEGKETPEGGATDTAPAEPAKPE